MHLRSLQYLRPSSQWQERYAPLPVPGSRKLSRPPTATRDYLFIGTKVARRWRPAHGSDRSTPMPNSRRTTFNAISRHPSSHSEEALAELARLPQLYPRWLSARLWEVQSKSLLRLNVDGQCSTIAYGGSPCRSRINRNRKSKASSFGQQIAIGKPVPSPVLRFYNRVPGQVGRQRSRCAVVKQDEHLAGTQELEPQRCGRQTLEPR